MTPQAVAAWMMAHIERDGCLYQDDVVDMLVKNGGEALARENADGNIVIGRAALDAFAKLSAEAVVWVLRSWRLEAETRPGAIITAPASSAAAAIRV